MCWVGGLVAEPMWWPGFHKNKTTPWLHLARFLDSLRIQDGAECGKRSEIELLFALCTRTVRDIKANFPTQYGSSLTCELCQVAVYCQENLLSCIRLSNI